MSIIKFLSPASHSAGDGDGGAETREPCFTASPLQATATLAGLGSPARPPSWAFLPVNEFDSVLPGQKARTAAAFPRPPDTPDESPPGVIAVRALPSDEDDIPPFLRRGDPACAVKR